LSSNVAKSCGCINKEKILDLTGQRFGRLTVLQNAGRKLAIGGKKEYIYWLCQCDCGNTCETTAANLKCGNSKSCGCLFDDFMKSKFNDLTGQRFGMLTVIKTADYIKEKQYWLCLCDCGKECTVSAAQLQRVRGAIKSCGCIYDVYKNLEGKRFHRLTVIEYLPEVSEGKGGSRHWRCICDCGNEILATSSRLLNGRARSCGCYRDETYIENIKAATKRLAVDGTLISVIASRKLSSANKSGVRGVVLRNGRYVASITFKRKVYYLGTYDTLEEAAVVRREAEAKYFDTFLEEYYSKQGKEYVPKEHETVF